jgi:hypothetical protein
MLQVIWPLHQTHDQRTLPLPLFMLMSNLTENGTNITQSDTSHVFAKTHDPHFTRRTNDTLAHDMRYSSITTLHHQLKWVYV